MGRKLGQHFLVNKGIAEKIIRAASLEKSDVVLEIGPGTGALTFALAEKAGRVIAVEKDAHLASALGAELAGRGVVNVDIITEDIRTFLDSPSLLPSRFKVVANIPYYLTSALIRALLEHERQPDTIFLMMQKEVARRIVASHGKESILSLSVKWYADADILFYVARGSFSPPPKVDSAVIRITPKKEKLPEDPRAFFTVVKAGFSAPRKKAAGNLAKGLGKNKADIEALLKKLNISQNARPETLSLEKWQLLTKNLI